MSIAEPYINVHKLVENAQDNRYALEEKVRKRLVLLLKEASAAKKQAEDRQHQLEMFKSQVDNCLSEADVKQLFINLGL